jgi:hypothetical protein
MRKSSTSGGRAASIRCGCCATRYVPKWTSASVLRQRLCASQPARAPTGAQALRGSGRYARTLPEKLFPRGDPAPCCCCCCCCCDQLTACRSVAQLRARPARRGSGRGGGGGRGGFWEKEGARRRVIRTRVERAGRWWCVKAVRMAGGGVGRARAGDGICHVIMAHSPASPLVAAASTGTLPRPSHDGYPLAAPAAPATSVLHRGHFVARRSQRVTQRCRRAGK